ncbi:hypothetical protein [Methylomicrobium sp. Wu6]|uniref:hypothetical protein n=1 Tax=Methylomicrobium sp. Wu6 TaxID=3107928 RepID=UPI002DD6495B|nr:hypothetical protein [Methylomicrobium sp. Wu6]MEC4748542.1 hypothetical protein [Methylomicrobium sp. Wu6]
MSKPSYLHLGVSNPDALLAMPPLAAADAAKRFGIAAQPLADALLQFSVGERMTGILSDAELLFLGNHGPGTASPVRTHW